MKIKDGGHNSLPISVLSIDVLLKRILKGMEGIKRIRETFRTQTGKIYGPDFIDRGIEIGMKFYKAMLKLKS